MRSPQIINPETGRYVSSTGKKGRQILKLYEQYGGKPIVRFPRGDEVLTDTTNAFDVDEEAFEPVNNPLPPLRDLILVAPDAHAENQEEENLDPDYFLVRDAHEDIARAAIRAALPREERIARNQRLRAHLAERAAQDADPEVLARRAERREEIREEAEEELRRRARLNPEQRRLEDQRWEQLEAEIALRMRTRDFIRQLLDQQNLDDSELLIRILETANEVNGWDYSDMIHNGVVDIGLLNENIMIIIIAAQKPVNMSIMDYLETLR